MDPLVELRDKLLSAPAHPFAYAVWHADLLRRALGRNIQALASIQRTVQDFYATLNPTERRIAERIALKHGDMLPCGCFFPARVHTCGLEGEDSYHD